MVYAGHLRSWNAEKDAKYQNCIMLGSLAFWDCLPQRETRRSAKYAIRPSTFQSRIARPPSKQNCPHRTLRLLQENERMRGEERGTRSEGNGIFISGCPVQSSSTVRVRSARGCERIA